MTLPKLTHGNGFEEPCTDASKYTETEDGCTASLEVIEGGIFDITVTQAAGNKIVYYKLTNALSGGLSSNTYKYITFSYKTSNTSIKAKIVLETLYGSQVVLPETSSLSWTTDTVEIDANKQIQRILFYATQATGHVFYNFAIIHKGTFELPDFDSIRFHNEKRKGVLGIPSRGGDIQQDLGLLSSDITIDGVMKAGETWGSETYPYGEYLLEAWRNDTFCWFTCDAVKCLVIVNVVDIDQDKDSGQQRTFHVGLNYYTKSDLRASIWDGTAWLGY